MSLSLISEVWDALRQHIQLADKSDAADTLVNLLVDNGFDVSEIKDNFRGDKEITSALSYFAEKEEYEDADWEDDYSEDEDDEW